MLMEFKTTTCVYLIFMIYIVYIIYVNVNYVK